MHTQRILMRDLHSVQHCICIAVKKVQIRAKAKTLTATSELVGKRAHSALGENASRHQRKCQAQYGSTRENGRFVH